MWDHGYDQMVAEIKDPFGSELKLYNTGGWCMVHEARLEGNAVIWISDYDAGLDHWSVGDWLSAMWHATAVIDKTAAKRYPLLGPAPVSNASSVTTWTSLLR